MKSTSRLRGAFVRTPPSTVPHLGFVCSQCRFQASLATSRSNLSTIIPPYAQRFASTSSDKVPFTEKLRKKIWGTETPPGLADPYANQTSINRSQGTEEKESDIEEVSVSLDELGDVQALPRTEYVPATTWDGLEHVGGATGWWEHEWDEQHQFRGFMAPTKMESREEIEGAIQRALAEVYPLNAAGRSLNYATNPTNDRAVPDSSGGVPVNVEGGLAPSFPDERVSQDTLESTSRQGPVSEENRSADTISTNKVMKALPLKYPAVAKIGKLGGKGKEIEKLSVKEKASVSPVLKWMSSETGPFEDSWLEVSLSDQRIKFSVLKRVMQLTGRRIPDSEIEGIGSAKALLGHLVKKPKAKKLAESLLVNERLTALSNVQILDRRYTPMDREKEVGRWKVIEKELIRRSLPVTGNA